jgi:hypothetical protein
MALIITTAGVAAITSAEEITAAIDKPKNENREAIKNAILNNDYQTWKNLVGDKSITENITEENWAKFVEMHQYYDKAHALRDELGLPAVKREMRGEPGMRKGQMKNFEAIKAALDANDYQAWLKAVGDNNPEKAIITEANFGKFVEAHKLMQSGDFESAQTIFDELGLKRPNGHQNGNFKE